MPVYSVRRAWYANSQHTAAIIDTVEDSTVLLGKKDTPQAWEILHESGIPIAPYSPPKE